MLAVALCMRAFYHLVLDSSTRVILILLAFARQDNDIGLSIVNPDPECVHGLNFKS
jgi:hypothetical protein